MTQEEKVEVDHDGLEFEQSLIISLFDLAYVEEAKLLCQYFSGRKMNFYGGIGG